MSVHCVNCGRLIDYNGHYWVGGGTAPDFCVHEPTEVCQNAIFEWGGIEILKPWEMALLDYKWNEPPIKLIIRGMDGRSLMAVPL